jgi:hypothetical protein
MTTPGTSKKTNLVEIGRNKSSLGRPSATLALAGAMVATTAVMVVATATEMVVATVMAMAVATVSAMYQTRNGSTGWPMTHP